MSWYYVIEGERNGPVEVEEVHELISKGELMMEDYVWTKGFDNWKKLQDVPELTANTIEPSHDDIPAPIEIAGPSFEDIDPETKIFFIKIGADRGGEEKEYGPFSLNLLKRLYAEKRINAKTFGLTANMLGWEPLAHFKGFDQVFNEVPPELSPEDKRAYKRSPLFARMFIENNKQVFEGICRDISVGGMQVLVDNFPGNVGDQIALNVHPENRDHSFVADGVIVRKLDGNMGFSFRFMSLRPQALDAIESYIKQNG